MSRLNKIVNMFLDYAEDQAEKDRIMCMKDLVGKLDKFIEFNDEMILRDKGCISMDSAKTYAEIEFEKYRVIRDHEFISDLIDSYPSRMR